ncbi:MAG TPA: TonB-dependent receptor [Thiobacillus sp.]|nr:TonB-dependent receptor [Thiobacillus sp.]
MPNPAFVPCLLPLLVAASLLPATTHADTPAPLMTIVVEGTPQVLAPVDAADNANGVPGDAAELLTRVPGAAVVRNGAQTGIVQLRGLFNERVRVRVDGMSITPACPNHMDPPLHYVGLEALDTLEVIVGATPVSLGGDSLAGSVEAKSRPPRFAADAAWQPSARVGLGVASGNDGKQAAVELGAFNDVLNLRYLGGYQDAGNYDSARGEVADTGYTNERHALAAAYQHGSGVWELEAGTHRASDVGTPTLPMDMVKDEADRIRLAFKGDTPLGKLEAGLYRHEIDHLMDNFSLRPVTGMRMQAPSTSNDTGLTLALANPAGSGTLKLGLEIFANDLDVYQQNMSMGGIRQDTFRDARRDRYGVYGEWDGSIAPRWHMNAGLRGEAMRMDTGAIVDLFAANTVAATAFNAQDHARSDSNLDGTLALNYALQRGLSLEGALTRRTRSPSILERYLWTPTSASAGQADGRTYLGNLDLDPEVAHGVNLGIKLRQPELRAQASVSWQDVSDFIQGQPIAMLDSNGRPVLQYANVNASLWGGEASLNKRFGALDLGTWVSFTRGENTDNGDKLYRIAPLRGGASADYRMQAWRVGGEWILSARKDTVAVYNGELPTPGYGILNLHAGVTPLKNLNLTAGVDNVFDKLYYDPLAGVNRVMGSSVPVGSIMPGMGRSLYVKMDWTY